MVDNDMDYLDIDDEEVEVKKQDKQVVKGGTHGVHSTAFKDFLLNEQIFKNLASNGFEHPSEGKSLYPIFYYYLLRLYRFYRLFCPLVQQQCLQNSLAGVDILCQAKSGMGKTAVFVLTILNRLVKTDPECSALIISHTRELAIQIKTSSRDSVLTSTESTLSACTEVNA